MNLLLFPPQAQAARLRKRLENQSFFPERQMFEQDRLARRQAETERRLEALEEEVSFLILMLERIVRRSEVGGGLTPEDYQTMIRVVDREEGLGEEAPSK